MKIIVGEQGRIERGRGRGRGNMKLNLRFIQLVVLVRGIIVRMIEME
jgi:hypothetical protein